MSSKQRLFEVMSRLDKTFKLKLNENINENVNDYLPISTPIGSEDDKLFVDIVNQGIDSHLNGFTKSNLTVKDGSLGKRRVFNFHKSELPILLRRLEELGTEEALQWKDDIENHENNINEITGEIANNDLNENNIINNKYGRMTVNLPIIPDAVEVINNDNNVKTFNNKNEYDNYLNQQKYFSLSKSHSFYSPNEYKMWSDNGNVYSDEDSKNSEIAFETGREIVGVWDNKNNIGYVKTKNITEGRHQPQNYHETLSSAIQDAKKMAESLGYTVNDDDLFTKFGTGGVGYGETKNDMIELYRDGKLQRKMLNISIYRLDSGRYELVTYIN